MRKAKIITVGTPKGGSGKSTTVETLAVEAAYQGFKVLVFDMDSTGSMTNFVIRRNELIQRLIDAGEEPIPTIMQISKSPNEKDVRRSIINLSNDYDLIIIDNHGEAEVEFQYTCQIADVVVYPLDNATKEIEQIPKMIELIEGVNEGRRLIDIDAKPVSVLAFINKVDKRKMSRHAEFKRMLMDVYGEYLDLATVYYPVRDAFKNTDNGTTVSDEKLKERAHVELLFQEIVTKYLEPMERADGKK